MTSQLGKQIIAIHILPSISRSTGNQTMKLDQLIKYNMKKIFLEKSYTKCVGKTSPRTFSKNQIRHFSGFVCFYCVTSWGLK